MTNNFTLLAGLRYELTPPFTNTLGNYFTVHIPTIDYSLNQPQSNYPTLVRQGDDCTDPYAGLSLRWTVTPVGCAKDFGLNNNLRETKYKNFAPRLGATYALGDRTVIRSGVGLYYMEDIGNAEYFDMARITAARVDTQASTTNALTWANAAPGGGTASVPPTLSWAAAYGHETPRTWQYLVNVERQLATNWSVELGYLGSQSRHLYGFQTLNQAGPGPLNSISSRVPYPTFGVISYVTDQNKGHYNAFSIKATRRYGDGLSLNTSYTLAKSIDNSSGTRTQGFDTLFPQDSRCMECETGPSSFDVRHRWVMGAVYELPFGKGKPVNIDNGRPGRHCRRVAVEHEHHDPERRSADALRRQGSIGHQQPGERPSELLGRGRRLCRRPLADALVRPRVVRLGSRGPIRDRRAQFDDDAASAADRRVAGEEFPAAEWPPHSGQGRSLQRVQPFRCGAHPTETSWRARHSRARPRTRRIRASASSPRRPSRCARFSSG